MAPTLDAPTLRQVMSRYLQALQTHREEIDSLNVFPVPDGDTGTNMLLTQGAVVDALDGLETRDLAELGEAVSRSALMGARGNSGVILSQVLRGLFGRLGREGSPGPDDLAEALSAAADEARRAVVDPAEGTMLSVIRDAADGAMAATGGTAEPGDVAEAALDAGRTSLERTRDVLPALAEAGVVDAGGKGILLLLDALVSVLRGVPSSVEVGPGGPVGRRERQELAPSSYGFEVMYLLEGDDPAVPALRERLADIGDALVVVGGGGLYNVHVHTDAPGAAVERGIEVGRPRDIRITSLDEAVGETCVAGEARAVRGDGRAAPEPAPPPEATQPVVAVADGAGLARLFTSLGAAVVSGGPGRNPSVEELVRAIDAVEGDVVFVLPNHPNVVPAAEAAARESSKEVEVVRTASVPEGLAAALSLDPEGDRAAVRESMTRAAERCAAGAVAYAERAADTPVGRVEPGDCVGIADDDVRSIGDGPAEVTVDLVTNRLRGPEHELVTLYLGSDVSDDEGEHVGRALREAAPDLEVEIQRGDQPRFAYLIGVE